MFTPVICAVSLPTHQNLETHFCFPESGVSSDDDDDEGDGSYLHPSLFASKKCNRLEELMKVLIFCIFYAITELLLV